jgi:hypothetical protein
MALRSVCLVGVLLCALNACAQTPLRPFQQGGVATPPSAPTDPSSPSPANGATSQGTSGTLTWSGCVGASAWAVLGPSTTNPPSSPSQTPGSASQSYSGLANSTTYYWKPSCSNGGGSDPTPPTYSFTTIASAPPNLLQWANISCEGVFLSHNVYTGGKATSYPIAMKKIAGVRNYFQLNGDGRILSFAEPTLSPCNSVLSSLTPVASVTDWGGFTVNNADNYVPGANASYYFGFNYDSVLDRFFASWSGTYSTIPDNNSFAQLNLTGGAVSIDGCYQVSGAGMPTVGSGVLRIPANFCTPNLGTKCLGVGFGGGIATSSPGGIGSFGPSLVAIEASLTPNACAVGVNYSVSGTTLARYQPNATGPNCDSSPASGQNAGCTPATAPTNPQPAQLAFASYSMDQYAIDWDPYGGHGWYNSDTALGMGWYDDGVKQGVIAVAQMNQGYINTTVSASPAPTMVYPNGTMRVASVDTHDGHNLEAGDLIWVQTCVTGGTDGAGCEVTNNKYLSFAVVDTVNTSTGDVAFHITIVDCGGVDCLDSTGSTTGHKAVVGGPVYFGAVYAHGAPTFSRDTRLCQIYDPSQYTEVIATPPTRATSGVIYHEEIDCHSLLPGYPSYMSHVSSTGSTVQHNVISIIPDPDNQKLIMVVQNGKTGGGLDGVQAIYVLAVAHTP